MTVCQCMLLSAPEFSPCPSPPAAAFWSPEMPDESLTPLRHLALARLKRNPQDETAKNLLAEIEKLQELRRTPGENRDESAL